MPGNLDRGCAFDSDDHFTVHAGADEVLQVYLV